jgi:hypothetical protein
MRGKIDKIPRSQDQLGAVLKLKTPAPLENDHPLVFDLIIPTDFRRRLTL